MAKLASDNIAVYPAARRGELNPQSRLITESALVNLINKLIDKQGFVITRVEDYRSDSVFEFNIFGYYFKVLHASDITSLFPNPTAHTIIYGKIQLIGIENNPMTNVIELEGQDEGGYYTGIEFTTTEPTESDSVKYLPLLAYENNAWEIITSSLVKFTSESNSFLNIDGGVIS